jgi:hypothetical protein
MTSLASISDKDPMAHQKDIIALSYRYFELSLLLEQAIYNESFLFIVFFFISEIQSSPSLQ